VSSRHSSAAISRSAHEEMAVTTVLEATATLPDYLDFLESTHRDAPLVLLETINALRSAGRR
jgi:chemosensory pili system protein ChpA (sensor histidine kinase/response regulator)